MKEIPAVHSLLLESFLSLFRFAKLFENIYGDCLDTSFPFLPKIQTLSSAFGRNGSPKGQKVCPPPTTFSKTGDNRGTPTTLLEPKPVAPAKRKAFSCLPAERAAHCSKYLPSIPSVSSLRPILAFLLLGDAQDSAPG